MFFFGLKTTAWKRTTNYYKHPGLARNNLRDYFWAGLRAGSNHYFLVIPLSVRQSLGAKGTFQPLPTIQNN